MKRKRRLITWLQVMMIVALLSPILPTKSFAEDTTGGGNTANNMSRSMIDFFRKDRTSLQVERVSKDELIVYGVFLSNFFIPWSTKLKDMVDDSGKDSIPKQMSTKFFGTPDRSPEITDVNKKLNDAITQVMGFDKKGFTMYSSEPNDASKGMTGEDFYKKMAGAVKDKNIYGSDGRVLLNLDDKATQASLQVIFGLAPDFMLSPDKGLRKLTGMYEDGLGNVWGSYSGASAGDYVLVLPASLNPVVFSKNPTGGKFPVSNVFTMGGVLKINDSNFLQDADIRTPYYNISKYYPKGTYNSDNIVSIFGVQSPTNEYLGNSNKIIKEGVSTNPMPKVKAMLDQDTSSSISLSDASIMVSVDATKASDIDSYIEDSKVLSKEERASLINYLFKTTVFKMNEVADDMYYFQVPLAKSQNASDGSAGSFDTPGDWIVKQKLFAREKESNGDYEFYSNSFMASPFNVFLSGYQHASNKDKYLKDSLGLKDKGDDLTRLERFLDGGTWGNRTAENVLSAMALLQKDESLVYGLVEPSQSATKIADDKLIANWFYSSYEPTSFALTRSDRNLNIMSIASLNNNWWNKAINQYQVTTSSPFEVSKGGGSIKSKDDKLTDRDVYSLSTFFYNAYTYRIFSMNSTVSKQLTGVQSGKGKYSTPWGKDLVNRTSIMNGVNNFPGIYWGYMVQMLDAGPTEDGTKWKDITPYENGHLPVMTINTLGGALDLNDALGTAGVVASEDNTLDAMQKDIIKKVYGILSDGPNESRDNLIKSTQDSWVISTHRAITGSWVGNTLSVSTGGNHSYGSVVGYINTPSLADLPLTNWVLSDYVYIYMFLLLLVLIILTLMVLTNMRTVREGILILLLMVFVLIIPQFLVSNVINIANSAGDKIYSGRFNYWAITQHQQSLKAGISAKTTGNNMDVLIQQNMDMAKNTYSTDAGVQLKWMSPKKDNVFDSMFNRNKTSQSLQANSTLFRWLFSSYVNQEQYVTNDPMATYLYRPYNAIAQDAYNSYTALDNKLIPRSDAINKVLAKSNTMVGLPDYRFSYFKSPNTKISYSSEQKTLIDQVKPIAPSGGSTDEAENYRYWLLNDAEVSNSIFSTNYTGSNVGITSSVSNPYYQAFSLSTESPFYYFYNALKHRYADGNLEFKQALLNKDMFTVSSPNTKVNNSLRDFLDMQGLFTYVIPYLNQGNEYVYGWTNSNGKTIDDFDFGSGGVPDVTKDPELYQKYMQEQEKKENMKKVWKMYTPWVDQLYNLGVMNVKVRTADKTEYVEDALNPGSYEAIGRPMIFSQSDMNAKSYRYSDLSDVERRIQATLDDTYKDMLYLTNYYDFDDEVLLTAAAMDATFNFNREFSKTSLLGDSSILYPQNFELKNFNYDAFMRLTLLNATGEPLMSDKDLYVRVLDKTSIFTGIILIINDILAVVAIPTMKVVTLLLLLFLSIAISVACIVTPPEKITKTVFKSLGIPSILFLVASTAFAFVISLFMGEGLTGYVGGKTPSVNISDPTITMGLMIVIDFIYLYVLWKIIKILLSSLKTNVASSLFGSLSLISSVGSSVVAKGLQAARGFTTGAGDMTRLSIDGAKGMKNSSEARKDNKRYNNLFSDERDKSKVKPFSSQMGASESKDSKVGDFENNLDKLSESRKDTSVVTEKARKTRGTTDDKINYIASNQRNANRKLDSIDRLVRRDIRVSRTGSRVANKVGVRSIKNAKQLKRKKD